MAGGCRDFRTLAIDGHAATQVTRLTFVVAGSQLFAYRLMTHHGAKNVGTTEPWTVIEIGPARQQILNS